MIATPHERTEWQRLTLPSKAQPPQDVGNVRLISRRKPNMNFGPAEVRAVTEGRSVPRCVLYSVLTSQTCGEPCWHAAEEVCRCSCGGRNHGCLLVPGGTRPERTAKIDGHAYRLLAVGLRADLIEAAQRSNGRQWRAIEPATIVIGSQCSNGNGGRWTREEAEDARARGENVWWSQYHYAYSETDSGAPARLKTATADQLARWTELRGWQDRAREGIYILWERIEMPAPPTVLSVNRKTGLPLKNQSPLGKQV